MPTEVKAASPVKVNAAQLITELNALAIPGVRTYSVIGKEGECEGVYPWDASAPAGEYRHISVSDADAQTVRDTIAAHSPAPTVDPQAELTAAIDAVKGKVAAALDWKPLLTELCDSLLGKAAKGKVAGRPL